MATIKPFKAVRPAQDKAARVAALPYDVYNREEAKQEIQKEKLTFLKIDRPETQFPDDMDMYDPKVYQKAKEMYEEAKADQTLIQDQDICFYIYRLTMDGRAQTDRKSVV